MADERDEIRRRIDIVDLVGRRVHLKKAGRSWKGLCPFHDDKTPSFHVNPEMGRYRCWACGEAGDIFNWIMKTQNVDFVEALRLLAKEAGVELKGSGSPEARDERRRWQEAMEEALGFFRTQFQAFSPVQDYCSGRGIDADTIRDWELGYAPNVDAALALQLRKKGHLLSDGQKLFLVEDDGRGGFYDKFRGRLIFPIRDERGELVAFGGRILGDGHPKYINSSDTPLYRKSRVLYGMHRARETIAKKRQAVLVEGYLDVIACHRAGVTEAVASLGTALAEEGAKLLKRWCDEVTILYDADAAGEKAAARAVEVLRAEGIRARVALMPAGEDPDTLLRTRGPQAVREATENPLSPMEYALRSLRQRLSPTDEAFWTEAVQILAQAPNPMELERHLVPLAAEYPEMREPLQAQRALRKWVAAARRTQSAGPKTAVRIGKEHLVSKSLHPAELVVFRAYLETGFRPTIHAMLARTDLFVTATAEVLARGLRETFAEPPEGLPFEWLHRLPDEARQTLDEIGDDLRGDRIEEQYLADSVDTLRRLHDERSLRDLAQQPEAKDLGEIRRRLVRLKGVPPPAGASDPFA